MPRAGYGHFIDKVVPVARRLPANSQYLKHLVPSQEADSLVRLASNENTDSPSPRVKQALLEVFEQVNLYPPPHPPLAHALAQRHRVASSQVLVTAGSTEVIDATLRTFVRAGEEVVIPHPTWPVVRRRLATLEARVLEVPIEADDDTWRYDAARIVNAIGPATKLVIVCTPNNPTGNAMSRHDVERVAATGIPLLIDGAYSDFDPDTDLVSLVRSHENVVLTRTFSKAYSLAGARVGYALGSTAMLEYVERLLVPGTAVSSIALHIGLAALQDHDHYQRQVTRITGERDRVLNALRAAGFRVWRSRGNFIAVDAGAAPGGSEGLAGAMRGHGVLVRPLGNLVRVTIGRRHENDTLIAAARAVHRQLASLR
jgi:histidinol-phosphate aminotransferase